MANLSHQETIRPKVSNTSHHVASTSNFASGSNIAVGPNIAVGSNHHEAIDWVALRLKLPPLDKSPESKAIRMKVFKQFDPNGNGYFYHICCLYISPCR